MKKIMREITELNNIKEMAERNLVRAMERACPRGITIKFWLRHGQVHPSEGVVIMAESGGYAGFVKVRMVSKKEDVKSVHFSEIFIG